MRSDRDSDRQRGAVLLVVVVLSALFSALAVSLLSGRESAVRGLRNAFLLARAERAAISGVEVAMARLDTSGPSPIDETIQVSRDATAHVVFDPAADPDITSRGRFAGVEATVHANVTTTPGRIHQLVSLGGTCDFQRLTTVTGDMFLGDPRDPFSAGENPACWLTGNLDLVAACPLPTSKMVVNGGQTLTWMPPMQDPVWDTEQFLSMTSGSVAVYHYTGATTLSNRIIDGIVVVDPGPGDTVLIENTTINGTLVVHAPYQPGRVSVPLSNTVEITASSAINGGTARTGNLAILAPECQLDKEDSDYITLTGVIYVGDVELLHRTTIEGMLFSRHAVRTNDDVVVTRPPAWTPNLPLGMTLPPSQNALSLIWVRVP